jgi:hypothetical protein
MKVNDENSRIRIHLSEAWIRGSGTGTMKNSYGCATLIKKFYHKKQSRSCLFNIFYSFKDEKLNLLILLASATHGSSINEGTKRGGGKVKKGEGVSSHLATRTERLSIEISSQLRRLRYSAAHT